MTFPIFNSLMEFIKNFSAFEQFEILRLVPIHPFGNFDISITNSTLFMCIAYFAFSFLFSNNSASLIPGR